MTQNISDSGVKEIVNVLEKNQNTLEQILVWIKVSQLDQLRATLTNVFDTEDKKQVYQLSDGRSIRSILDGTGIRSTKTVSEHWNSWFGLGLMKKERSRAGRETFVRIFDLEDLGLLNRKEFSLQRKVTQTDQLRVASSPDVALGS